MLDSTGASLLLTLAQTAASARSGTRAAVWAAVLIVTFMLLGAGLIYLKRRLFEPQEPEHAGSLLEHLRHLNRTGQLSDAEFQAARLKMQQSMKRALDEQDERRRAAQPVPKRRSSPNRARTRPGDNPPSDPPSYPPAPGPSSPNSA